MARSFSFVWFRRFWFAVAVALLLTVLVPYPARSQGSQQISFRLSRIESDMRSLQSQVNQLSGQMNRLQRQEDIAIEEPVQPLSQTASEAAIAPSYDQLATLVIETRQDVFVLQAQLAQLEARLKVIEDAP
ncbi:MAG: hypothetical protein WBA10_03060 [Elainellaceae cyanobacterium]